MHPPLHFGHVFDAGGGVGGAGPGPGPGGAGVGVGGAGPGPGGLGPFLLIWMSAQLAKITDSCKPSQRKLSVQRSQLRLSGIRIRSVNLYPTGLESMTSNQISPLSFLRMFFLKQSSVSLPSKQIRYWYFPPWLAKQTRRQQKGRQTISLTPLLLTPTLCSPLLEPHLRAAIPFLLYLQQCRFPAPGLERSALGGHLGR
jgi:hypothetical protein